MYLSYIIIVIQFKELKLENVFEYPSFKRIPLPDHVFSDLSFPVKFKSQILPSYEGGN